MQSIMFILTVIFFTFLFIFREYSVLVGIFLPVRLMKRVKIGLISFLMFSAGMTLSLYNFIGSERQNAIYGNDTGNHVMVIVLTCTLITVMILNYLKIKPSSVLSVLGSIIGVSIFLDKEPLRFIYPLIVAISVPAAVFALSMTFNLLFNLILKKTRTNLLLLSYYMRYAVGIIIVGISFSVGFNHGLLYESYCKITGYTPDIPTVMIIASSVILIPLIKNFWNITERFAEECEDYSLNSIVSVSTALLLLTSLVHVPVTVYGSVKSGIGGAFFAKKHNPANLKSVFQETGSAVASILFSAMLSYLLLNIYRSANEEESKFINVTVLAIAALLALSVIFISYVKQQKNDRRKTDLLLYSKQQQIYEHSRALNEMEMKTILSENQLLHATIELKRKEAMNIALGICEQKEYLGSLKKMTSRLYEYKKMTDEEKIRLYDEINNSVSQRLSFDHEIDTIYFSSQAESLHKDFTIKLNDRFPNLTPQEKRLATLLCLGFSSKYISTLMNITPKSVEISRYRLRQKLKLGKGDNLVSFLQSL